MASQPSAPPGHFTVLYFAAATSYTKRQHDFLEAPLAATELWNVLNQKYPGIKEKVLESAALTVNLDYVDLEEEASKEGGVLVIHEGDEVGVIPPLEAFGLEPYDTEDIRDTELVVGDK